MTPGDGLDAAIDELYAHPPSEFVARRDALVTRARGEGDRRAAARIKALRRPTVGAWYLNTAARGGLDSLTELLRLGTRLRDAQAAGDFSALRELAAQRGPLVARVVRELTARLAELGTTATAAGLDEVRTTLASALAEAEVAEELAAGRLDRAHQYSGFGTLPTAASTTTQAAPPEPAGPDAEPEPEPKPDADTRRREEAEQAVREAEDALAQASAGVAELTDEVGSARDAVEHLETELTAARQKLSAAQAELDQELAEEESARVAVREARDRLAELN